MIKFSVNERFTMAYISFVWFTLLYSIGVPVLATKCGCKTLSSCYVNMLEALQDQDEAYCIEDAAIGTSTITVFLKALQDFCSEVISVETKPTTVTYDMRNLYQVIIHDKRNVGRTDEKNTPVIVIDAGQEAGTESVNFALYIIEQLVACQENKDMIQKVKWVIMPSTNPDGLEYSRFKVDNWQKNLRVADDGVSFGVDISRNFDEHWDSCPKVESGFSPIYPGVSAASENETIFIKAVLNKYQPDTKIYLSLRRNGHCIGFPFAFGNEDSPKISTLQIVAAEVASKVNSRSGGVHIFANNSIYKLSGKAHCGHSVDYAASLSIPLTFEMRVFLGTDKRIMSKFQTLPRGYSNSLRNGYFSGIRELYSVLTNEKKYGKILQ